MSIYNDLLQIHAINKKNFIERRRNLRLFLCEYCSHFILIVVLVLSYGLSEVITFDSKDYSSIRINYPVSSSGKERYHWLEGPTLVPSFDAYNLIGLNLRNELQQNYRSYDELQEALLKTDFGQTYANLLLKSTLHLAPDSRITWDFVKYLKDTMVSFDDIDIRVHANEDMAINYILDHLDERAFALVVLDKVDDMGIEYTLRFNYTLIPNTNIMEKDFTLGLGKDYQQYLLSGFMSLQSVVNEFAFNSTYTSGYDDCRVPRPVFIPFPTPPYDANPFFLSVGFLLGLAMVMSTLYPVSRIAKSIVEEKEIRMRELLKISGVKDWVHHFTWFINGFILFFWVAVTSSRLSSMSFMPKSDRGIIFMFFFLFNMSEITLAFLISVFFSNAKLAAIAAPVVLFCFILPRFAFVGTNAYEGATYKYIACLLSPTAFSFGAQIISDYEYADVGVNYVNITNGDFSMLGILQMLLLDIFIYALLAWYFDLVLPSEYGTARHPLFFASFKYWSTFFCTAQCMDKTINGGNDGEDKDIVLPPEMTGINAFDDIELLTTGEKQKVKIVISNVHKQYGNKKVAVRNLSLAMCESQVTCLLGHNGAGKSTTMNILTGLTPSSSGCISIYGYDQREHLEQIRSLTGICMQLDVLYPWLTVHEHLMMFGNIRGLSCTALKTAVDSIMESVFLVEKRDVIANSLSGGMKRKLCLAIALIGDPKFLVLDEPTSGLDPYSRRAIWNLIQQKKSGRVVMLSTHFMDEADLLGDRIAILSDGQIRCSGSSLFLKTKFGAGYVLSLSLCNHDRHQQVLGHYGGGDQVIDDNDNTVDSRERDRVISTNKISSLVTSIIPGASLRSNVAGEIMYTLPLNSTNMFATLFTEFEKERRKQELGIVNFGITITSLEQIFVALAKERSNMIECGNIVDIEKNTCYHRILKNMLYRKKSSNTSILRVNTEELHADVGMVNLDHTGDQHEESLEIASDQQEHLECKFTDWICFKVQLQELLWKRYIVMSRDKKGFFFQVIFPVLQVILILAILTIQYNPSGQKMRLSASQFTKKFHMGILDGGTSTSEWFTSSLIKNADIAKEYARMYDLGLKSSHNLSQTLRSYLDPRIEPMYTYEYEDMYLEVGNYKRRNGAYIFDDQITTYIDVDITNMLNGANSTAFNVTDFLKTNNLTTFGESSGFIEDQLSVSFGIDVNITDVILQFVNVTGMNLTLINLSIPELITLAGTNNISITTQIPSEVTIMHNTTCPHATVMFQNDLVGEAFKKCRNQNIDRSTGCGHGYCAFNHPLPVTRQFSIIVKIILSVVAGLFILVPLCYLPAAFVTFLVKERMSKSKHLQLVSGVPPFLYWLSTLIWDYCLYCILVVSIMLTLLVYGQTSSSTYVNNTNSSLAVFVLLMSYGLAVIPLSYAYSFLFENYSTAQISITVIHFITGFIFVIAYYITVNIPDVKYIGDSLTYFFWWFPPYNVGQGLLNISANYFYIYLTKKEISYLSWNVTGRNITFLILQFVFFFGCILILETNDAFSRLKLFFIQIMTTNDHGKVNDQENDPVETVDGDVADEKSIVDAIIDRGNMLDYSLLLHRIKKTYGEDVILPCKSIKRAVQDMNIALLPGERFGLLGINGAGKSTTLNMVTGDIAPTSGCIYIAGRSLKEKETRMMIGYCPQTDPLLDLMNAYETLWLYGRIRCNISNDMLRDRIDSLIKDVGLTLYAHRPCGSYSGGNRRKLSLALALIGDPKVLFLDEPSTGMDPESRRSMWDIINRLSETRSLVLTTHSMEECEAICTRIGIMSGGRLHCIGTNQHLKGKFGCEYQIEIKCASSENLDSCLDHMKDLNLNDATIIDERLEGFVRLRIQTQGNGNSIDMRLDNETKLNGEEANNSFDLSKIFSFFEENKDVHHIASYSVSQSSLEQIFIQLAKSLSMTADDTVHH